MSEKDLAGEALVSFDKCEVALRSWIAKMAIDGKDECVFKGLDLVKQLDELEERFNQMIAGVKKQHGVESLSQEKDKSVKQTGSSSNSDVFPVYFVHDGSLVKFGKTRSSDLGKLFYRKSMPLKDVSLLIDLLIKFVLENGSSDNITIRGFIRFADTVGIDFPEYKIYLLFGALEAASVVAPAGRGSFTVQESSLSRSTWENKIKQLEERRDLMDEIK